MKISNGARSSSVRGYKTYRGFSYHEIRKSSYYYPNDFADEESSSPGYNSSQKLPSSVGPDYGKGRFTDFFSEDDSESSEEIEENPPKGYLESRTTSLTQYKSSRTSSRSIDGLKKNKSPL